MSNYTEHLNIFIVGKYMVYSAKKEKLSATKNFREKNSSPHEWIIVKFCSGTYRGPSEQTQLKPAHRKSKDKHSCQPPATLFKYFASWVWLHTYKSDGWLMTNSVIVHAGMWVCMLTVGAAVKCLFSAFENLNNLTLNTTNMPICNKPPGIIL